MKKTRKLFRELCVANIRKQMGFLSFFILISCGQHDHTASSFNRGGEVRRIEKTQDRDLKAQEAIFDGNLQALEGLLKEGWNAHQPLPSGNFPLVEACLRKKPKMIRWLLKNGSDGKDLKLEGLPLADWVMRNQEQAPEVYRAYFKTEHEDTIELEQAVTKNQFVDLKKLVSEGVEVNTYFSSGETPLTLAIQLKSLSALRALFNVTDLNVNLKNKTEKSPLQLARGYNLKPVILELIKRKAEE